MVFYKITLKRSLIGLPKSSKSVASSLGLGKTGSVVYREASPSIAGSIAKIKEVLNVEVTEHALSKEQQRELRKSNPGFTVEKRV
ncbi:LADA_0H05028g1_1 [Lachancea dasiensis]|uniref:Large ribosomal subunit protein uL30m n=1 Tax=Lachancea dasiensis TaxID=1072105 RepID=A0A1G4K163_9SACH|nr:LADA_0H05028g1_1 [Lachancea dasiensis]